MSNTNFIYIFKFKVFIKKFDKYKKKYKKNIKF